MVQLHNLLSVRQSALQLTAYIDSALCVGAGGSTGSLADKPIVRTSRGQLLIPASQLKGRLRHECEKLARGLGWPICESPTPNAMCPQIGLHDSRFQHDDYTIDHHHSFADGQPQHHCLICQIFGNPALPSRLMVDDLVCSEAPDILPDVLRPGVTINRRRGTAEDQKLYFLETSPVNLQLPFQGELHFEPNCPSYAKALIVAAINHIHALGGSKSAGLGWLTWEMSDKTIDPVAWEFLGKETTV